jgi:hypothetical protein
MSNIVPFENAKLPAYLASGAFAGGADDLTSGVGQGYPIISIKGKVFHVVKGEERTLITKPNQDGDDEPASSIEVVILRANPNLSKVYYSTGYTEGSDAKPDCYSNDGKTPATDAEEPQAKSCATCPHNQWGSRITENDKKGKACSDSRRVAVATPDHLNEPMLVRVPAASLKPLAQFGDMLKKRGVPNYSVVVTRIGFDYTVAHPALTFKPVGFLSEAQALEAAQIASEEVVAQIIGTVPSAAAVERGEDKPVAEKSVAKSKALEEAVSKAEAKTEAPAKVKVEAEDEPEAVEAKAEEPKAKAKVKAKPVEVNTGALEDEIADALDGLDFDD